MATAEITRGDKTYELTFEDDTLEEVVLIGREEDIDPTLFEPTITLDEWLDIRRQLS